MPQYKLTYFDLRGRGELIRMLFAVAGVKFEDHRVKREDWSQLKSKMPWGQIPVLYVDGKPLGQSNTIARYLANEFGLAGENAWEKARIDEIVDALNDLGQEYIKFIFEKDDEKKAEIKKNLQENVIPKYLAKLDEVQAENGGNFFVGKKVSWADILFAERIESLEGTIDKNLIDNFPNLKKLKGAVLAIPNLKAYVGSRPPA